MAHLAAAGRRESAAGRRLKGAIHCDVGTFRNSIEQQPPIEDGSGDSFYRPRSYKLVDLYDLLVT
jgi:hypothetical protein